MMGQEECRLADFAMSVPRIKTVNLVVEEWAMLRATLVTVVLVSKGMSSLLQQTI